MIIVMQLNQEPPHSWLPPWCRLSSEFAQMMKRHPLVLNLREVFRQFDMDKDGYISESELRIVCRQLSVPATDREVSIMFQAADKNGDGRISFDGSLCCLGRIGDGVFNWKSNRGILKIFYL